jgi:hypothetical protein
MANTAKDLKSGDEFKWTPRQKNFRTVNKIVPVPESGPEHHQGGFIIVLDDCKTIVLPPCQEIILKKYYSCIPSTKSD